MEENGVFTVLDPALKLTERTWKYLIGAKIQSLKPSGTIRADIIGDFNLNTYRQQLFPTLEFGVGKMISTESDWKDWNALIQLGYSSILVPFNFPSGYSAPKNTRFNTMKVNLGLDVHKPMTLIPESFYKIGIQLGKFFYTQTSSNDLAQFSESLFFAGLNLGANFSWNQNLDFSGDYIYRQALNTSTLKTQAHNFELGLRVKW